MARTPVIAALSKKGLLFYKSGIIDESACTGKIVLDHAVLIVGYGIEGNKEYWIVKNTWG